MTIKIGRQPLRFTFDEYLSDDVDLPSKLELVDGIIGLFSDRAKKALLANWGADKILTLTGADIWREVLEATDGRTKER